MQETTFNRIRLIIATAVLVLFSIGAFCQTIDSLVVVPENPATSDEVFIHVYGWLWSSDVYIADIDVVPGSYAFTINIDCQATGIGLPVLVPFDTAISLGMLSAYPAWGATVNMSLSGNLQGTDSIQFEVAQPTSTRSEFQLYEPVNYPNPFTERTTFRFSVAKTERIELTVYDILGAIKANVVSQQLPPGEYHFPLDTKNFSPGKYFYQLRIGNDIITQQIYRSNR